MTRWQRFLCAIGLHDWQCVESVDPYQVYYRVRNPNRGIPSPICSTDRITKHVCLRCHAIHDEITKEEQRVRRQMERERLAEQIAAESDPGGWMATVKGAEVEYYCAESEGSVTFEGHYDPAPKD